MIIEKYAEKIECPECHRMFDAVVEWSFIDPEPTYLENCPWCGVKVESELNVIQK